MGHERWIRGQHDGEDRPFDWLVPAEQQGIPEVVARALYEQALEQARGAAPDRVEELHLDRIRCTSPVFHWAWAAGSMSA